MKFKKAFGKLRAGVKARFTTYHESESATPDYSFDKITDITPEHLREMGVEAVAFDLDNTTVDDASYHLPAEVKHWIEKIRKSGIKVGIVSNTFSFRAWYLSKKMGNIPFEGLARKPHTLALRRAAKKMKTEPSKVAMVGDQLFTDMLVANRVGAVSIKVKPRGSDKYFTSHFKKIREQEDKYLRDLESACCTE